MNFLAQVRLLQEHADLDEFVFQGPGGQDWVARMEDSQERAAQVCIFEAARALAMLVDTYPIATVHPKWKSDADKLGLMLEINRNDGKQDRVHFPSMPYAMTWTDAVDGSEVWQEAILMLDDICQPSICRCAPLLNRAFSQPMDSKQLIQASREHANPVEMIWQEAALRLTTAPVAGQRRVRRP